MASHVRSSTLGLACGLAIVGIFLAPRIRGASAPAAVAQGVHSSDDAASDRAPKSVETTLPVKKTMSRALSVPATVQAYERVDVHTKVSGFVSEVLVDIGARVQRGEVLAVLSVPELEQELVEARVELQGKRVLLEVARTAEVVAAEATVEQARRKHEVGQQVSAVERVELSFEELQLARRQVLQGQGAATDEELDMARHAREVAQVELAVADARALEAGSEVAQAEAALVLAKARIDVSASDVSQAEARVQRLEMLSDYTRIRAPFDGVVTRRTVDHGALVQEAARSGGMPLFTVQRVDRMRVAFDVPEVDLPFVAPGASATLRPYASVGPPLEGVVSRVANSLEVATRTMRAEIDLDNADGRLVDGMYMHLRLAVDVRPDVLTLPAAALLHESGKAFVYVVADGVAEKRALVLGLDDGIDVEVQSGLAAHEAVVVVGMALISPGARVRAVPRVVPSAAGGTR